MSTRTNLPPAPIEWQASARCLGLSPADFYPEGWVSIDPDVPAWDEGRVEATKAICAECPVQEACLDFAIGTKEAEGIWGGLTGSERRALVRKMKKDGITVPRYGSTDFMSLFL